MFCSPPDLSTHLDPASRNQLLCHHSEPTLGLWSPFPLLHSEHGWSFHFPLPQFTDSLHVTHSSFLLLKAEHSNNSGSQMESVKPGCPRWPDASSMLRTKLFIITFPTPPPSHCSATRLLTVPLARDCMLFNVLFCAVITAEDATPHPSSSYLLVDLILVKLSPKWAAADGSSSVPGDCRAPCSHCTLCPVVPADLSCRSWDLHATLDALASGAVRGSEPSLVNV